MEKKNTYLKVNRTPRWYRLVSPYFTILLFIFLLWCTYSSWQSRNGGYFPFALILCLAGLLFNYVYLLVYLRGIIVQITFDLEKNKVIFHKLIWNVKRKITEVDFSNLKYDSVENKKMVFYDGDVALGVIFKIDFADDFERLKEFLAAHNVDVNKK